MLLLALPLAPMAASAATCTVTNASDFNPATESSIPGSLRACIDTANGDSQATTISFSISGAGPHTISVKAWMQLTEASTTIDGFSQSGSAAPTSSTDPVHKIVLDGTSISGQTILHVTGDSATIKGLRIQNDPEDDPSHVITIDGADGTLVSGCTLSANVGGILVMNGAASTQIGGPTDAHRNVVEDTTAAVPSINVFEAGTGTLIEGNRVEDSADSSIGAFDTPGVTIRGNVITGAGDNGILVFLTEDLAASTIEDNTVTLGTRGIVVYAEAEQTAAVAVEDNTVTDNDETGIGIMGGRATVTGNTITDNLGTGITFISQLGDDPSPSAPEDDTVGGGTIGGSGALANDLSGNDGGIMLLDTTVSNAATLEDDNTFDANGDLEALQAWRGLIRVHDDYLEPVEGADVEIWGFGMDPDDPYEEPLDEGTSDEDGYVGVDIDPEDPDTWLVIPEWAVFEEESELVRYQAAPHLVRTTIDTEVTDAPYSWDGEAKLFSCAETGGLCRYGFFSTPDRCDSPLPNWECAVIEIPQPPSDPRYVYVCGPTVGLDPAVDLPLVLGYHGGLPFGTAFSVGRMLNNTGGCDMNALAARDGFIVAYPGGENGFWNDCKIEKPNPSTRQSTGADVEFTDDAIAALDDLLDSFGRTLNTDRIYAWGVSNGGVLTYRLATLLNGVSTYRFEAIAAAVSNKPDDAELLDSECIDGSHDELDPTDPPSVLIMNGDADVYWMNWNGGWMQTFDGPTDPEPTYHRGLIEGAEATVDWWLGHNSLGSIASSTPYTSFGFRDKVASTTDGSTVSVEIYGDPSGNRVAFYTVDGGGHTVPGTLGIGSGCSTQGALGLGCQNDDISGPEEIWRFFQPSIFFDNWDGESDPDANWDDSQEGTDADLSVDTDRLEAFVDVSRGSVTDAYVVDELTSPVGSFRARFWIDADLLVVADGDSEVVPVLATFDDQATAIFAIWLKRDSPTGPLSAAVGLATDDPEDWASVELEESLPQLIEVGYRRAVSAGNGSLCIYRVDDDSNTYASGSLSECISHSAGSALVDEVWLGLINAPTSASGSLFIDGYESYRP